MSVRRVGVKLLLLAGAAAALSLLARARLERRIDRHVDEAVGALADVARTLPVPRAPESTPPLPPLPPAIASAIASGVADHAPAPAGAGGPRRPAAEPPPKAGPTATRVTRAEVDAAIANKCGGVRAVPARDDDGVPIGFTLRNVGALSRFGVQEGDVLIAADGHALRTADEAFGALGALKDARRVTFVLRRGGGSYAVTLALEE